MKTKGITIWEQHAEKIALGIGVVVFAALTAGQFIGEPNAVKTPGAGSVGPADVDALLQDEAERILSRLDEATGAEIALEDPVPAYDALMAQLDRPVYPTSTLDLRDVAIGPNVEALGPEGNIEFPVPEVKRPYQVMASQTSDALEDGVIELHPELQELFPDPDQPPDITFATAFATFDLDDLRRQFRGEHIDLDAEGKVAIPTSWYHERPENILDVVIERQELVDDKWTDAEPLDQIPGRFTLRRRLAEEIDAAVRDDILIELSEPANQNDIVHPDFYLTVNEAWTIPGEAEVPGPEGDVDEPTRILWKELARARQKRDRLDKKLEELGGSSTGRGDEPPEEEEAPPPRDRRGGSGRKGPPGAPGGMGTEGGGGKRDNKGGGYRDKKNEKTIRRIKESLDRLNAKIAVIERQLGLDKEEPEEPAENEREPESISGGGEIWVWGHDLWAEPGKTYRYRVTVEVYNPFFGRKRNLVEEQQPLAEAFTLDAKPSDWSAPIRINPRLRVFITNASASGQGAPGSLGLGRATAEVYQVYNGHRLRETFAVEPGGYIGAVKRLRVPGKNEPVPIDFRTGLFVLDVVEDVGGSGTGPLDAGRRAKVLLQNLETGEILALRDPIADLSDPDRLRLRDEARATEDRAAVLRAADRSGPP